jgi:hypothetical protein
MYSEGAMSASKGWRAALGCGLLLLDLVAIVVVITAMLGTRSTPTVLTASASIPAQLGAASRDNPQAQQAEAALLMQLQAAHVPISPRSTIQADALCIVVNAGGTSSAVAAQMIQNLAGLSAAQASIFVDAARTTVCELQG